ncbi:DNA cytosine methyltransferase [Lonepinella sp. BR2474]|uniref:DNA cytosine methyltransferase n=1 Tax=Lonepinella sp. BR2474 TaxID=3434548 RepID=UPI003F6DB634
MLNTIDLFAGCGGLTDGFKQSNKYNLLAGVEWDKQPLEVLRNRLEKKWGYHNVKDIIIHFDLQRTQELINGFHHDPIYGSSVGLKQIIDKNNVDVIIGGPPCQAYSIAGRIRDNNGMKDDYRNYLFESYIRIVEEFKPLACIFENVTGMLSATPDGKPILDRISLAFNNAGYAISENIKEEAIFDVSEFGVPQKRKRVIIIAVNKEKFTSHKEMISEFYSEMNKNKEKTKTVHDAISDLPKLYPTYQAGKVSHISSDKNTLTDHEPRFHSLRDIKIFQMLANDIRNGENKYTSTKALQEIYTQATGKLSNVHKYHVLRENMPSNTIPAHLYKDGLRHIHPDPEQGRSITVREAARLQSFSDDFQFMGSMGAKYKMIGNAVPPLFAKKIAIILEKILTKYK